MNVYKARGIVLHTIKYGDSGVIAYLLTDVFGRQSYMIQGVRSSRGHGNKTALLQPMFAVEFEGVENPRAEMHRIREIRAAFPLRSIPFDIRKSTLALFMAELLYRLVREVEPSPALFDFVWKAVETLDKMGSRAARARAEAVAETGAAGVANFHLWFMVGLSRYLGFYPAGEWAPGSWFDIKEGHFTPIRPRHNSFFSQENTALLGRLMCLADMADETIADGMIEATEAQDRLSLDLALNRTRRVDFLNSMLAYFGYHLDATRDIRSVDILREVF